MCHRSLRYNYSHERIKNHELPGRHCRISGVQRGGACAPPRRTPARHPRSPGPPRCAAYLGAAESQAAGACRPGARKPFSRRSLRWFSWRRRRRRRWSSRPCCSAPGRAWSTSAAPSGSARRRTTPPGTRRRIRAPDLLAEAVYGLPEFCRDRIAGARLLSNPGCYPTAANLAIRPLIEAGLVDRSAGIVCDAKSGVSGAGNKPSAKNIFCEVTENFSAYSILHHRHVPEVLQVSGLEEREFSFTAQLLPIDRGILETIYFRTAPGVTAEALLEAYERRYAREPFIRLYNPGHIARPARRGAHEFLRHRRHRAMRRTGRAVVVSAIDNLVKGAAGQAIQNMNLMLGLPETEGLL